MRKSIPYVLSTVIALLLIEVVIRLIGYSSYRLLTKDEMKQLYYRTDVEQVKLLPYFKPNNLGIMVYDKSFEFNDVEKELLKNENTALFDLLSNYYSPESINEYGFRDWRLSDTLSTKKKIAIIGDSFVWGIGSKPVDSSFVNLLKADSALSIFNLSVPGSDLCTYAQLAKKYLPIVKPEITIVCIYYYNDLVNYDKQLIQNEYNDIFPTNAGAYYKLNTNYQSDDSVEVFTDYRAAHSYNDNIVNFASNVLAFAATYNFLHRKLFGLDPKINYDRKRFLKINFSKKFVSEIEAVCTTNKSKLFIVMIPDTDPSVKKKIEEGINHEVLEVNAFTESDFNPKPDGHLNNKGNLKYAKFIKDIVNLKSQ